MEEDNKPKLTIVSGGKDKQEPGKRTGKTPEGLTLKQEAFAQAMAGLVLKQQDMVLGGSRSGAAVA